MFYLLVRCSKMIHGTQDSTADTTVTANTDAAAPDVCTDGNTLRPSLVARHPPRNPASPCYLRRIRRWSHWHAQGSGARRGGRGAAGRDARQPSDLSSAVLGQLCFQSVLILIVIEELNRSAGGAAEKAAGQKLFCMQRRPHPPACGSISPRSRPTSNFLRAHGSERRPAYTLGARALGRG